LCNNFYGAFTLAEVLITLGIIGVVASMTLPALINNTQNRQLQTGLQKAYSTLNQALLMYANDNGEPVTSSLGRRQLKQILLKYIRIVKDCGNGSTGGVDRACVSSPNIDIYKNFNGKSSISYPYFDDGQFVMNDNMFVMIENYYSDLLISVDVNGLNKRPNRLGQDLFMFQINNKGALLPMGAEGTKFYSKTDANCSTTSTNKMNGAGCTAKALSDKDFFKNLPK